DVRDGSKACGVVRSRRRSGGLRISPPCQPERKGLFLSSMTDWRCVLHLAPDPPAELALARTLAVYQELAAWLDGHVPAGHPANLVALHRAWYERARRETRLPAQMVTLALRDWVA